MLILGDSTVIPISERLRLYSSADDIGDDFGVDSQGMQRLLSGSPSNRSRLWCMSVAGRKRWLLAKQAAQKASCRRLTLCWTGIHGMAFILPCRADYPSDTDIISVAAAIEAASVAASLALPRLIQRFLTRLPRRIWLPS
jgi:hypothetical protein